MESIYNLVPYEHPVAEKKPMYRSSNDMKASVPGSTFGTSSVLSVICSPLFLSDCVNY